LGVLVNLILRERLFYLVDPSVDPTLEFEHAFKPGLLENLKGSDASISSSADKNDFILGV
jgi:hypothetical protein